MWEDLLEYETRDGFGFVLKGKINEVGYKSIAVPGSVRGFHYAHKKFGKLPWKDVLAPAIAMAENGYKVQNFEFFYRMSDDSLGRVLTNDKLKHTPDCARLFYEENGAQRRPGSFVRNPDLAKTLTAIANEGPDASYTGSIGQQIVEDFKKNDGFLSAADLEELRGRGREADLGLVSRPPHRGHAAAEQRRGRAAHAAHAGAVRPEGDGPQLGAIYPGAGRGDEARPGAEGRGHHRSAPGADAAR